VTSRRIPSFYNVSEDSFSLMNSWARDENPFLSYGQSPLRVKDGWWNKTAKLRRETPMQEITLLRDAKPPWETPIRLPQKQPSSSVAGKHHGLGYIKKTNNERRYRLSFFALSRQPKICRVFAWKPEAYVE